MEKALIIAHNPSATIEALELLKVVATDLVYDTCVKLGFSSEDAVDKTVIIMEKYLRLVPVHPMFDEKDGKKYPSSPFKLHVEYYAGIPVSIKPSGYRWDVNLTKLGVVDQFTNKEGKLCDRIAYSGSGIVEHFSQDTRGIARVAGYKGAIESLVEWKNSVKEVFEPIAKGHFDGSDPTLGNIVGASTLAKIRNEKDLYLLSQYEIDMCLGEARPTHTPYGLCLPEVDSAVISMVVYKPTPSGGYYQQLFGAHWNVGLTHSGGNKKSINHASSLSEGGVKALEALANANK